MKAHKTYLITSAVKGADAHLGFCTCLAEDAKRRGAEVIVATLPGLKKGDEIDPVLAEKFKFTIAERTVRLGRHINLMQFRLRAAQQNPLMGLSRFIADADSAIIPSTKQFLQPVATLTSAPRVFYTTGTCTKPLYAETRVGEVATFDHMIGAVVVECGRDGYFNACHVQWRSGNGFVGGYTDRGMRTQLFGDKGGVHFKPQKAVSVTAGDWHTGDTDPMARAATFDMFNEFEPNHVVVHDIFNGHSINHHERDQGITRAMAHRDNRLDLTRELREVAAELVEICKHLPDRCKLYVAKSNHDDWLARYLQSGVYNDEPNNVRICLDLAAALYDGKDPLEVAVRRFAKLPKVKFLRRKEKLRPLGWEIGQHGDAGQNGSKGNTNQLEKLNNHAIIGHQHTPCTQRSLIVVGTNTKLNLPYNDKGPSSWLHSNAVVWPDGSAQNLIMPEQRQCKWGY